MPSNKSIVFQLYSCLYRKFVAVLWNSQQKKFKAIGKSCGVLELPYVMGYNYIEIGDSFSCGKDVRIEAWDCYGKQEFSPRISIGNNVTFTDRCYISCVDRVDIGDGVLLGRDVFITDNSHGASKQDMLNIQPLRRPLTTKGPVIIGKNVWIGRQVTVLSGVTIGENTIIGANSVVNKDIPANCVAAGNPAIVLKQIES